MPLVLAGVATGNLNGPPASFSLNDLTDVDIVSPANGQYLVYDSAAGKWENAALTLTASGDATGSVSGSNLPLTLATVNSNVGTYGSASQIPVITVNAKGLVTSVTTASASTTATDVNITNDTTTNSTEYLVWSPNTTGSNELKVSSTKFTVNPSTGVLSATQFSGSGAGLTSIPNGALTNSSITVGSTNISLGATATTLAGLTSVTSTSFSGSLTGNATSATNIAGGAARQVPFQSATGTTSFSSNFTFNSSTGTLSVSDSVVTATVSAATGQSLDISSDVSITLKTNGTSRLSIGSNGAFTIGGGTGTAGQVLISNGSSNPPSWSSNPTVGNVTVTDITYGSGANTDDEVLTTTTTSADQVVTTLPIATYRSAKFQIQISSGSAYAMTEISMIHNGTTVFMTEYGTVMTGASLASFDADISGGNMRLLVTPVNASTTIKILRTAITV